MTDSSDTIPKRRAGGFRPGEDMQAAPPLAPPPRAPSGTGFTEAAEAGGSDLDVLMGYQIFLGRDPENSFVIADAKTSPVRAFIRALMGSGEFQGGVLDKLRAGMALPHERFSAAPAREQIAWLQRFLELDAIGRAALQDAAGWRDLIYVLVSLPAFPGSAQPAASAAAGPEAEAAGRGFVLINIDQPKPGEAVPPGARITGSGWAIAPADVSEVAVHLDGRLLTHATYGLPRPDVARGFPHYRHVDHCGFTFAAEIPADFVAQPTSQIMVTVRTGAGDTGRKGVRVGARPQPGQQAGAGSADGAQPAWPIRVFVEDAAVNRGGMLRVRGWAASQAPLESVAVHLGGEDLGRAETGLPRPDIARDFPHYPNAALSGFALVHRLEAWQPGPGYVRVEVRDAAGHQRQAIVPVTLPGPADAAPGEDWLEDLEAGEAADGIVLCCDTASVGADGSVYVSGWAVARSGVAAISVALDGAALGAAATGGLRADLQQRFPENPHAGKSGFSFRHAGRARLDPGLHEVGLLVRSRSGGEHKVALRLAPEAAGQREASSSDMRLEIDRPLLDGTVAIAAVRGALTVSGWAVARGGVDHVAVLADGELLGRAYFGMRREDIGAAFADFEGAQLSGWALVLPPGTLAAGTHAIVVAAYARDGAASVQREFSLTVEEQESSASSGALRVTMPPAEAAFGLSLLSRRGWRPAFTIVVKAEGAPEQAVLATLESLGRQILGDWTALILLGGRGAWTSLLQAAGGLPGWDAPLLARLRPVLPGAARKKAMPDRADALAMVLRAGDVLGCDALLELAIAGSASRKTDLFYADELRRDPGRGSPQIMAKPGFAPEMLLAANYLGRAFCVRAALLDAAGLALGFLAAASDYDMALRLVEAAGHVAHVGRVLLARDDDRVDSPDEEQAALRAALARRRIRAEVHPGAAGTWRIARAWPARTRVSIIIPTCGARDLVRRAVATIRATAPGAEIVIVDNVAPGNRSLKTWLRRKADRVVDAPGAFNWSRFNNIGAASATGDMLLFLNDDIEAQEAGWLEALLEQACAKGVGVVGARLLYPDGKVQHAGQYLADGHARHAFRFAEGDSAGPFGLACMAREMMSVTGACLMTARRVFARLGGFEEAHSVVNNDLDYCLRAWREGFTVLYTPHATLIHHELASRASLADTYDEKRFAGAWRERFLAGDPFRSPRLRADDDHYAIDPEPCGAIHAGRRGPRIEEVRRILAIKLDHIGDFLTALPALRSLRARFPQARIEVLAPPASAALARTGKAGFAGTVDEVIEFTFFHARSGQGQREVTSAEFEALGASLAARRYDMAIDLRMHPETRPALRCSGAPFLVGYDHGNEFPWLDVSLEWEGDLRLAPKRGHISERLVQLVAAAEAACLDQDRPGKMPVPPAASVPALAALPAAFRKRPLVCVHPGVGNVVRQWPAAHFAGLIDLLRAECGVHVVLVGTAEEAPIAEEVQRLVVAKSAVESLVGRVKLGELAEVMRACVLFVGNNSGPKHLAASLGVPTVGIHSGVVDATEWAPLGPDALALRRHMVCGPCYLEFASECPRGLACLTAIRPRDVLEHCIRIMREA